MPELQDQSVSWDSFYSDYVSAYLERDVRDLINVKDEAKFYNFMVACAARLGQLFNASDIGNSIDADHKTVQSWLSILEASGIAALAYSDLPGAAADEAVEPSAGSPYNSWVKTQG